MAVPTVTDLPAIPDLDSPYIPPPVPELRLGDVEDLSAELVAWSWDASDGHASDALDRSLALERYLAKRGMAGPMQTAARHLERRIGELLGEALPGRPKTPLASGVSEDDRYRFRRIAEAWSIIAEALPCSRAKALYLAAEAEHRDPNRPEAQSATHRGDFRDVLDYLPDESVALILTDPPYDADAVPLYGALGEFADRVLIPGGSVVAYAGGAHLPAVMDQLGQHLRYWWTLALIHGHGSTRMVARHIYVGWKPLLWYVKGGRRDGIMLADTIAGVAPEKSGHEWAQGDECGPIVEALTLPGETVVDPFAGSATIGTTALRLGRNYVGADDR